MLQHSIIPPRQNYSSRASLYFSLPSGLRPCIKAVPLGRHELLNDLVLVLSSHNQLSMPLSASGASAKGAFSTRPLEKDPYEYQVGFKNFFASEAL